MTYCLGWRTGKSVIIAADAVVTSPGKDDFPLTETSFGEPHIVDSKGKKVQERALKIFNIRNKLILTYTGSTLIAHGIALSVARDIDEGSAPLEAVKSAIGLNINPASPGIRLIFSFLDDSSQPVLMSFNVSKNMDFDTHDTVVQAGSISHSIQDATQNYLLQSVDNSDKVGVRMAKLLAALQSYGRTGPLMASGAGGVFSCMAINAEGTHSQPDILHVFSHSNHAMSDRVSVCMRRGCVTARRHSTQSGHCFTNKSLNETDDAVLERTQASGDEAERIFAKGRYDFIIFQNLDRPAIALVEMRRKKKHDFVWLEPFVVSMASGLQVLVHPELSRKLNESKLEGSYLVHYFPYRTPSRDCPIISEYKRSKKEGDVIGLMWRKYF